MNENCERSGKSAKSVSYGTSASCEKSGNYEMNVSRVAQSS
jgi:hypothetical protein